MYSELIANMAVDAGSAQSLASAAVVKTYYVGIGLQVRRFAFQVKTAVVSTGSVVVKLKQYPIASSSSSAVELSSLTIPAGATAGSIYYKDVDSAKLSPGNGLVVEVTTAAAGGGAAGDGYSQIDAYHSPESPQNVSVMIASA